LDGFFKQQKEEVLGMSLTEFDEEIAIRGWREDGIEEGKTIGAQQKAVETIKNALEMNLSIEKIEKLVSLPVENVLEIQKQIYENA
jgi:predicted transposase YdaD